MSAVLDGHRRHQHACQRDPLNVAATKRPQRPRQQIVEGPYMQRAKLKKLGGFILTARVQ